MLLPFTVTPQREKHARRTEQIREIRKQLDAILVGNIRILSLEDLTRQMITITDLLLEMDREIEDVESR